MYWELQVGYVIVYTFRKMCFQVNKPYQQQQQQQKYHQQEQLSTIACALIYT
jgi:hypothetical protein